MVLVLDVGEGGSVGVGVSGGGVEAAAGGSSLSTKPPSSFVHRKS